MELILYHCGEEYRTDSANIGRGIKCRNCGKLITIEAPYTASPVRRRFSRARLKAAFVFACGLVFLAIVIFLFHLANNVPEALRQSVPRPSDPPNDVGQIPKSDLPSRSLPNGMDIIEPIDQTGSGKLTVINGTAYDAFVKLSNGGIVLQEKYVTAGNSVLLEQIKGGLYRVVFSTGVDFDGRIFTRNASYKAFDEPIDFSEKKTPEGDFAPSWKITLHPVLYGNAGTHDISKKDFEAADLSRSSDAP